ncbi:MAG: hypothetical protein OXH99_23480, partial [Bryobacterales bacterium]|nr:hypothetical protein [Bryobacterales bacterium]
MGRIRKRRTRPLGPPAASRSLHNFFVTPASADGPVTRLRLDVADIFRRYGAAFRERSGSSLTALLGCVMTVIERCLRAALGG